MKVTRKKQVIHKINHFISRWKCVREIGSRAWNTEFKGLGTFDWKQVTCSDCLKLDYNNKAGKFSK